jgi:hypothetical protein
VSDLAKRLLSRSILVIATLSASWSVADAASAEDALDRLVEQAQALPAGEPRFITNYKQGLRAATYSTVAIAPSDPSVIYVTSMDGYVFGTQDTGVTWNEGRLIVSRQLGGALLGAEQHLGPARLWAPHL